MPKIIEAKRCYRGQALIALINYMESDKKPTYLDARRILERVIPEKPRRCKASSEVSERPS